MLPAYNMQNFSTMDLRRYHIRDIKDVLRFIEFTVSRLDEAKHIINKTAQRCTTLDAVVKQMQTQQKKMNELYGAPTSVQEQIKGDIDGDKAVVQEVTDQSAEREKAALLDDIRQAAANETVIPAPAEDPDERLQAEYEKYKMVRGKTRDMYYREGRMVSAKDVPEDIKAILEEAVANSKED